jgi:hypothetical protein
LEAQKAVLLPIPYFHVVFTLPHALNPLIRQNPVRCYDLLFASASATLLALRGLMRNRASPTCRFARMVAQSQSTRMATYISPTETWRSRA